MEQDGIRRPKNTEETIYQQWLQQCFNFVIFSMRGIEIAEKILEDRLEDLYDK